jgi:hypothetical protein
VACVMGAIWILNVKLGVLDCLELTAQALGDLICP